MIVITLLRVNLTWEYSKPYDNHTFRRCQLSKEGLLLPGGDGFWDSKLFQQTRLFPKLWSYQLEDGSFGWTKVLIFKLAWLDSGSFYSRKL